jgi:hypothetical protein
MENEEQVRALIHAFLEVNPKPADAQVHQLAAAVGMDHETLEAIVYKMLAEQTDGAPQQPVMSGNEPPSEDDKSEAEQVLDGDYDPNVTTPDDLLLNDGAPEGTSNIQESQDALYTDGTPPDDIGLGVSSDKDAMISDGAPPVQLKAGVRLLAE